MIVTGENRSTGGNNCPSADVTCTDLGSNPILRGEWPMTNGATDCAVDTLRGTLCLTNTVPSC